MRDARAEGTKRNRGREIHPDKGSPPGETDERERERDVRRKIGKREPYGPRHYRSSNSSSVPIERDDGRSGRLNER